MAEYPGYEKTMIVTATFLLLQNSVRFHSVVKLALTPIPMSRVASALVVDFCCNGANGDNTACSLWFLLVRMLIQLSLNTSGRSLKAHTQHTPR